MISLSLYVHYVSLDLNVSPAPVGGFYRVHFHVKCTGVEERERTYGACVLHLSSDEKIRLLRRERKSERGMISACYVERKRERERVKEASPLSSFVVVGVVSPQSSSPPSPLASIQDGPSSSQPLTSNAGNPNSFAMADDVSLD